MPRTNARPMPPFNQIDYHDHFQVTSGTEHFDNIDQFAKAFFLNQPSWLTRVSAGIGQQQIRQLVSDATFPTDHSVGNWKVLDHGENSITFGEDMRIMAYRVIFSWVDSGTIDAKTEVVQASRWVGRLYWALASKMHQRFLPMMLRNAAGDGSTTHNMLA